MRRCGECENYEADDFGADILGWGECEVRHVRVRVSAWDNCDECKSYKRRKDKP